MPNVKCQKQSRPATASCFGILHLALIRVLRTLPLLGRSAQLVVRAVGAPRIRLEPFLAGERQDVTVRAERSLLGGRAPAAGLELLGRRRQGRRRGGGLRNSRRLRWIRRGRGSAESVEFVHHP